MSIQELKVTVHAFEKHENKNGGFYQLTLVDYPNQRVLKENFFTAKEAIKNTIFTMETWIRNLLDESFKAPDPEFLIIAQGVSENEAYVTVVNSLVAKMNELIGKEIEIHQEKVEGVTRAGVARTYYNLRPWKYAANNAQSIDDNKSFDGFL